MDMDDDDEFGDLYTDVLRPISFSAPHPIPNPPPDPPALAGADRIPTKNPSPEHLLESLATVSGGDTKDNLLPDNWNDDVDGGAGAPVANFKVKVEPAGSDEGCEARVSGSIGCESKVKIEIGGGVGFRVPDEVKIEIGGHDEDPVIPGISAGPLPSNGDLRISNADDWDSDSEDDLQIVLNDDSHAPMGRVKNEDNDDDEDGDEDLVIITDEDQQHHHHQAMDEPDWGEGELQPAADGERKEGSEAAKVNGAVGGGPGGPRIGYGTHGFHPQHHSMFKYIRPGTAAPGAPTVGPAGQMRPPSTMGPVGGRGRGDWRPAGVRGISGAPKSFHSGFGPGWANNPSRAFGGGLDFTLPSHKTIFDVDIEGFEEKPWRHPGVDVTDYFNFGFDEDKWKDYWKQLDQLRLESTMQSKIRVYESGRSEQDYDPDLPPELAAAAGHHDVSADNMNHGKMDNVQFDLSGQGRGLTCIRPPFPPGRPIQVETGSGERLPSIDTRPPRTRDADAIIEIVLQGALEDSTTDNNALDQPEKDIQGEEIKGSRDTDDDKRSESESYDRFPRTSNGRRMEMGSRRIPHAPEGDDAMSFPSESPLHYNPNSRLRSPVHPAGSLAAHHRERLAEGGSRGRYTSTSVNLSNDSIPTQSGHGIKHDDHQKEKASSRSMEANPTPELSPPVAAETAVDLSIGIKDDEHDAMLALGDSIEVEGEEMLDFQVSGETLDDDSISHSSKKQKLSSRVEQAAIRDNGDDDDDLRATHSDNSLAKSGSSNQRRLESGGEEVQGRRSRRDGDVRRCREEEDHTLRRKDDYGREVRHAMDRRSMGSKGREAMHHSYPHRDWDQYSAQPARGRSECFERAREAGSSFWQRREDDTHVRRIKDEDIRRERSEEAGSRNRFKVRVSERTDKDDDNRLKKRLDDGDWRSRHREGVPRPRERDDILSRRDNLEDHQVKRKRDEENSRRENTGKEDSLHGYMAKEDSSRRKRDREENPDNRRIEDSSRLRENADDHHSSKHKDESWRQREREDRQRLKYPHEDHFLHRERVKEEGRGANNRSGRAIEDKPLGGSGRNKSDSKILISDKDYQHKDRRHHTEQSRRGDVAREENDSQHKGREDVPAREKHHIHEERSLRHKRLSAHGDRTAASDNMDRHREITRKHKDTKDGAQAALGKKKLEDHSTWRSEKVSSKGELESNNTSLSNRVNQLTESSDKQGEGELALDDESQHDSKRGRSKMERWTSHKEMDYVAPDNLQSSSSKAKEVDGPTDLAPIDDLPRTEGNDASESDPRGADGGQTADKSGDDKDRHLDTVEKLKRRSERFKLPMPGEKDVASSKRPENDTQGTQQEAPADNEVKPERPPRKRRWINS